MITRAALAAALAVAILAAPLAVGAQPAGVVARIGVLGAGDPPSQAESQRSPLRQALREVGWVKDRNLAVERRYAEGKYERLPGLAAELVQLKVDIILALDGPAALAAKDTTKTVPIVFVAAGAVVETGLVASLARPGGNATGNVVLAPELSAKRLELLTEILRKVSRVAVLWNSANPFKVPDWKATQAAARRLGVTLQSREVRGPDDFEGAFTAILRGRPDALVTLGDPVITQHLQRIVDFTAKSRLPTIYDFRTSVDAGGLMSYGPNFADLFRSTATYVDKILKGARPADLPVQQATRFELVVNLTTAKALGLTIPPSVLLRADQVIE